MTDPLVSDSTSERIERRGQCLCGAVRFTAKKAANEVGACHCAMCRRWSGSPLMTVDCGTEVVFEGADNISVYDSSEWAERGFCSVCGSNLFYRLKHNGEHQMLAGLFDDPDGLQLEHQVFIDQKPDFYAFSNKTRDLTGAEVFALYGASE